MIKKVITAFLIVTMIQALAGCGANKDTKKFVPPENSQIVEKQTGDLNGDGKQEYAILYVVSNKQGIHTWELVVNEVAIATLDSQDGAYTLADIKLQNVDGEKGSEIICYRYNTGSGGGQGLNVYSYHGGSWQQLFNTLNTFDDGKGQFAMKYLGNYQVSFEDQKTGLNHNIVLDKNLYEGSEKLLQGITTWVDPVSEYRFANEEGKETSDIISIQRVIGVAHADTIATWQTTYRLDGEYQPIKVALVDYQGMVLAEKNL